MATPADPTSRYSAIEGARLVGSANVELHHSDGHDQSGRNGAFGDGLRRRFGRRRAGSVERLVELLAQQNAQQIAARATFHFGRAFAKCILRSDRRGIWSVEGTDASETQTARPDREVE